MKRIYSLLAALIVSVAIFAQDAAPKIVFDSNPIYVEKNSEVDSISLTVKVTDTDVSKYNVTLGYFDESFDNRAFSYVDTKPFLLDVCVMAWNKLYRKSFIDECQAEFPEGLIFEDGPFFFSIFFKTKRVSIVRDFLYCYRINRSGSIIQKAGKNQ